MYLLLLAGPFAQDLIRYLLKYIWVKVQFVFCDRYLSMSVIHVSTLLYLVKLYTCTVVSSQGVLYLLNGKLLGLQSKIAYDKNINIS